MCQKTTNHQIIKHFAAIILLNFFLVGQTFSQTLNYIAENLASLPQYKHGEIAIVAKNLSTNKLLINYNANKFMIPASTQKLFTTSAALSLLKDSVFTTLLQYDGVIKDSTLQGNLYIYGKGDPTLGSNNFDKPNFWQSWINAVKKLGINKINGNIIADASYFELYPTPQKWTWEDLGNYYGASPTALCIYDNTFKIYFKTGSTNGSVTKIIKTQPEIPELNIFNQVTSAAIHSDHSYIIGAPFCPGRRATGQLPMNRDSFTVKASIPDPPLLVATQFKKRLENSGIKITGIATTTRVYPNVSPLALRHNFFTYYSPNIKEIVKVTNHKSVNLYAEILLNHLGKELNDTGSTASGIKVLYHFLRSIGLDTTGLYFVDGSGLSRYNAITADNLLKLLSYMYFSPQKLAFLSSLPTAGRNGTLKYVGRHTILEGRMFAKSGSMSRVRAYAGYLLNKRNETIAFVIILNNFTCSQRQARKDIERLLIKIAQQ